MEFKWIEEEDIPAWYELSWQEKPPAIILRIHKDFIQNLDVELENSLIVKSFKEDFGFERFSGDFNKDIGFERVFKRIGEKNGFIEFLIEIPRIKKETNEVCPECHGSGVNECCGDETCRFCKGTGKDHIITLDQSNAISVSFTLFTELLYHCHKADTCATSPQLLTIAIAANGDFLSGEISIPLTEWLTSLDKRAGIPEVVQAMKTAYEQIFGLRDYHNNIFQFLIKENGKFILICPGNACGLYPSDWNVKEGKGCKFTCYNIDGFLQLFTLLAGLCALCDAYRKAKGL